MYREDDETPKEAKPMSALLGKYLSTLQEKPTAKEQSEYAWYLNEMRKLTKMPFIVMHKRIEKAFGTASLSYTLSKMRDWYFEAEKHGNPGMIINSRLKQHREKNSPPSTP